MAFNTKITKVRRSRRGCIGFGRFHRGLRVFVVFV